MPFLKPNRYFDKILSKYSAFSLNLYFSCFIMLCYVYIMVNVYIMFSCFLLNMYILERFEKILTGL